MAKSKKQTKEERLVKKRLAARKRYEIIKNDPDLWKEKQEKNRQSYLRRKQEKKQLPISEMTPRQQRLQRQTWRKNYRSYYLKKKREKRTAALLEQNTPPQSPSILPDTEPVLLEHLACSLPPSPFLNKSSEYLMSGPSMTLRSISVQCNDFKTSTPSNTKSMYCSTSVTSAVRRIRYEKDKIINDLKKKLTNLKQKNERYRKQLKRMAPKRVENQIIKRKPIVSNKKQHCNFESLPNLLKEEVRTFYESDENSRLCSGKKEFIVRKKLRKQKRYLSDHLLNLHKKFLKTSNFTISYSTFCKLRPFWVLLPDSRSRDTCLCKLHTNMDLIIKGLYQRKIIPVVISQNLLSMLCCDMYSVDCLHRNCLACKNKVVCYQEFDNSIEMTYWQWDTKKNVTGVGRKIRITEKVKKTEEPKKCIEKFESMLKEYLMHCGNIVCQYNAFKKLKKGLREGECIIHIDYSENYAVKSYQEIQSYHFGGSRKQLTLHTSVIYFLDAKNIPQVQSFCTVSECLRHDISAVWAHIVPILEYINEIRAGIHTLHFISDSPSSQYRNKKIFHMISSLHIYLNTIDTITWNYSEAGHGKGAPDGVGAVIKRTADRAVSQGQDIKDLDDFLTVMNQNLKKIKLKTISEYDVFEKDLLFPQNVKAFPGCMKMHQIVWNLKSPMMAVRKLSCTDKNCLYDVICCNHKKHLGFYHLEEVYQENLTVTPLADSTRQLREIPKSFWSVNIKSDGNNGMTGIGDSCEAITNKTPCKTNNKINNLTQSANHYKRKEDKLNERKDLERSERTDRVEQTMAGSSNIDNISEITFSRDGDKDFTIDLENINPYLIDDDEEFNIF